jgi:hypothetical protein
MDKRVAYTDVIATRKTQIFTALKQQNVAVRSPYSGDGIVG